MLLGLPSTGLHTNGYSLARKLLFEVAGYGPKTLRPGAGTHRRRRAAAVHRSYLKPIRALLKAGLLNGAAHITGGGITDNTPRILPEGLAAAIDTSAVDGAADFRAAAQDRQYSGRRLPADVQPRHRHDPGRARARRARRAEAVLRKLGETVFRIGEVVAAQAAGGRAWSTDEAAGDSDLRPRIEFRSDRRQHCRRTHSTPRSRW